MCVCASQRIWSGFSRSVIISTVTEKECVCWKTAVQLSKQIGFLLCLGSDTQTHFNGRLWFWFSMGFVFIFQSVRNVWCGFATVKICVLFFPIFPSCVKSNTQKVDWLCVHVKYLPLPKHQNRLLKIQVQVWVFSLKIYSFTSSYVMYFLQFLLTQQFKGSVYVAHILRFGKHALKSHRATRITAGQDSDRACGLAGIFLCTSVIMGLPPHARHSHYLIIIWQMSVWLTSLTGWPERVSCRHKRLWGGYLGLGESCVGNVI